MLTEIKNLERFQKEPKYLEATVKQLQKDFSAYADELQWDQGKELNWTNLNLMLQPLVARLLELDIHRFFQILYAIDLPEQVVKQLLVNAKSNDAIVKISELIIKREFQKVVIRDLIKTQYKM